MTDETRANENQAEELFKNAEIYRRGVEDGRKQADGKRKRKRASHSPFAILKAIEKETGKRFRFHDTRFWIYAPEWGAWVKPKRGGGQHDGAGTVRGIVAEYLGKLDERGEGVTSLSYTIGNVCEAARATLDVGREPPVFTDDGPGWKKGDSAVNWVAMGNGLLDLLGAAAGKKKVLYKFTPSYFSTRRLPFKWDPSATCPKFEKALKIIIPDPEGRDVFWKFLGLMLFDDTKWQVMLYLVGVNGSGKSVLVAVAKSIVGEHASLQFHELLDPFKVSDATRYLSSIADDPRWPAKQFREEMESVLLTLLSGEFAEVNDAEKYVQGVARRVLSRFLIAQNAFPRYTDPEKRQALSERTRVVYCPNHFRGTEDGDVDFFKREIRPELPGIFARAVREYGKLAGLGKGEKPYQWFPDCKASRERMEAATMPEMVAVRKGFREAKGKAVRPKEVRDWVAEYCKALGIEEPKWRVGYTLQTAFPKCNPNGTYRFTMPNGKKGKPEKAVVGIERIPADEPPEADDSVPLAGVAEERADDFDGVAVVVPDYAPPQAEDAPEPVSDDWKPADA